MYAALCAATLYWYVSFPLEYKVDCDPAVVEILLVQGISVQRAMELGCTKTEVIGRPHGYTALLSAMFGAAPFMYKVYVGGRREDEINDSSLGSDS